MKPTAIKIETGIPVPETRGRTRKYPFDTMKTGQSFFIEGADESKRNTVISSFYAFKNKRGNKGAAITTRMVDGGLRVWRTA